MRFGYRFEALRGPEEALAGRLGRAPLLILYIRSSFVSFDIPLPKIAKAFFQIRVKVEMEFLSSLADITDASPCMPKPARVVKRSYLSAADSDQYPSWFMVVSVPVAIL